MEKLSLIELKNKIQNQEIKSVDVCEYYLNRIKKIDPKIKSYITINESVLDVAAKIDEKISKKQISGRLVGIPLGIKDMFCTKGIKTTAGSKMLSNFVPFYESTVTQKLKNEGALFLGKLNQDEFAMGSTNENSFYGATKNPWNLERVAGGSSGGSAAAQAAKLCAAALGTDTGGSVRLPAHFCGVVGLKPTYGRVSRYGMIAYASSLDQAGILSSTVKDAALILECICGEDNKDSTTSSREVPHFLKEINSNIKGLKVAVIKEHFSTQGSLDPCVEKTFKTTKEIIRTLGAEVVEVSIPLSEYAIPIYYLIASSEASSNLARYDGVKYGHRAEFQNISATSLESFYSQTREEGFGHEVKRRIMLGTHALSSGYYDAYFKKAAQVRQLLRNQFLEAFNKCDLIVSPVATTPAFKLGEKISDPLANYLNDIFTVTANLAGLPGMSVPVGFSKEGLPIGFQILAPPFEEQKMLNLAQALEDSCEFVGRAPNV